MEQILPVIFIHLHIRDIIHVCTSSKILSEFLHSKSLWMSLILRDFLDCKPFKCPLFTKSSSISTSKLLSHYRAHFETSFSCGLGLRLSSDVIQLAVGDFLTFTTTIYNNTSLELEIPVGYSHIGKYYEQGALMRSDWDEQGYRRAVYSLHSPCLQSTHILAIIPPGSFVQFTSKAKLRDLQIKKPKKWARWYGGDLVLCFPSFHLPVQRENGYMRIFTQCMHCNLTSNILKIQVL